jgi:histidine ammonia-lyase
MQALHINGNDLTLSDVRQVVYERRPVLLQPEARLMVERARAVVDEVVENERVAYAVNTGVGHLADLGISRADIRKLQVNLVRSHSVGVGEPLGQDVTRAMMLLRANSLAKGFSGVRPLVIDTLCEMVNRGVHPVIPSQGSVGASGDLAPLAHLALALIGEGEVLYEGERMAAAAALKRCDIKPLVLEAKDAISRFRSSMARKACWRLDCWQCCRRRPWPTART